MAGTAKDYTQADTFIGSADVWLKVAIPAANGIITLHTDGTPESVANPTALHIGVTRDSTKVLYKPTTENFFVDQFRAPWRSRITAEEATIEGNWLQLFDTAILTAMTLGGTLTTTVGHERVGFGGVTGITTYSVAVIGELSSAPGKYAIFQLFQAFNQAGFEFMMNQAQEAQSPFSFVGQAVTSRAAGDQVGYLAKQL